MMKIGLNTNTFPGETLDVLIPMAKDFGVKYLELCTLVNDVRLEKEWFVN